MFASKTILMPKPAFALLAVLGLSLACCAQPPAVTVPSFLRTPLDSIRKMELVRSLDSLIGRLAGPDGDNRFVDPDQLVETYDLLDEIRGMDIVAPGRPDRYRCYLTNVAAVDSANWLVQFAYLRMVDSTPVPCASFRLLAHSVGEGFLFSSALKRNTATWHVRKTGNFSFHYFDYAFNESLIRTYMTKAREFDRKLGAPPGRMEFYCCKTLPEAMQVLGVDYKLDYAGSTRVAPISMAAVGD